MHISITAMKRAVAVVTAAILTVSMNAFAADTATFSEIYTEFVRSENSIIATGILENGKINQKVSGTVTKNGSEEEVVFGVGQGSTYMEDGVVKFSIRVPVLMTEMAIWADLKLAANFTADTELIEKVAFFATDELRAFTLKELAGTEPAGVEEFLKKNYEKIEFPITKYEKLKKSVPGIEDTISNIEIVITGNLSEDLAAYKKQYEAIFTAAEISAADKTQTVVEKLNSELINISTNTVYGYFEEFDESEKEEIYDAIMERTLASYKDVHEAFEDAVFCQLLADEVIEIDVAEGYIKEFAGIFGISMEAFEELEDDVRKTVVRECLLESFSDRKAFESCLEKIMGDLEEEKEESKPRPSNGNQNTSSSRPSTGTVSNAGMQVIPSQPVKKDVFNDMTGYEWAKNAVEVLEKKDIINGYADNSFKPGKQITRAEFVQILTKAFVFDTNIFGEKYSDVKSDAWYYRSVMIADEAGIVKGNSNLMFLPDELITREDMCTMVYRAVEKAGIKLSGKKSGPKFDDEEKIAEYAKTAVNELYKSGIVNGMDEHTFAPEECATRAQAAKIIYELVLLSEGEK